MTPQLKEQVLRRDNYTCRMCGNSIYKEPNLLLEVDHIIPISKGGKSELCNLQTLCWKCNRSKSNNIIVPKNNIDFSNVLLDIPFPTDSIELDNTQSQSNS